MATQVQPAKPGAPEGERSTTELERKPADALAIAGPNDDEDPGDGALSLPAPLVHLPVELEVGLPVRAFRVRNLLALAAGQVVETQWHPGSDLPLAAGDVQLAWTEFEVIDTRLGVRLTRLA